MLNTGHALAMYYKTSYMVYSVHSMSLSTVLQLCSNTQISRCLPLIFMVNACVRYRRSVSQPSTNSMSAQQTISAWPVCFIRIGASHRRLIHDSFLGTYNFSWLVCLSPSWPSSTLWSERRRRISLLVSRMTCIGLAPSYIFHWYIISFVILTHS